MTQKWWYRLQPWRAGIQGRLIVFTLVLALVPAIIISAIAFLQARDSLREQAGETVREISLTVGNDIDRFLDERRGDMTVLSGLGLFTDPSVTSEEQADFLRFYRDSYGITYTSFYITDVNGIITTATDNAVGDLSNQEWFQQASQGGDVYLTDVYYLPAAQRFVITAATALVDQDGTVIGVLAGNIDVRYFGDVLAAIRIGEAGQVRIVNREGFVVLDEDVTDIFNDLSQLSSVRAALRGESGTITDIDPDTEVEHFFTYAPLVGSEQGWVLIADLPLAELNAPVNELAERVFLVTGVSALIILIAVYLVARQIVQPIRLLTGSAQRLSQGDFKTEIPVRSQDEVGQLADTFRYMATEVSTLVDSLEGRVEARTRDLQTVFDVGKQIGSILDVDRLLQDIVDLTKERFNLYHAHIYLMDEEHQVLNLVAGAGYVGRQMVAEKRRIALSNTDSIVATAARSQHSVVINDVSLSETFLPNPLLPNTLSELSVALLVRGQVLGVLDVQSDKVDYFSDATVQVIELMASQVATAINNARLYSEAEQRARIEGALGKIERQILESVDLDEMLQVTVRELGKALRVPHTAIELKVAANSPNGSHSQPDEVIIEAN